MEISNDAVLNEFLSRVESEKEKIKNEIEHFFNENKKREDIGMLLIETFDHKINGFRDKYNASAPKPILGDYILTRNSIVKTIDIYLDLARYPAKLIETLDS